VLYNTAFESVPASDHPRMKGPVDQSKNKQVKDYKGLTAECEEEVYNMLCVVGPALLRAVATARFATAPAASADSPRDPSARRARAVHPPAADCAKVVFLRYLAPGTWYRSLQYSWDTGPSKFRNARPAGSDIFSLRYSPNASRLCHVTALQVVTHAAQI
jgi:hypothetical protein